MLYKDFAGIAEQEGFLDVATAFKMISKVEKEHENRYRKLRENILGGKVFKKDAPVRWMCRNCGYVHEGTDAPAQCPACLHPQAFYEVKSENY